MSKRVFKYAFFLNCTCAIVYSNVYQRIETLGIICIGMALVMGIMSAITESK